MEDKNVIKLVASKVRYGVSDEIDLSYIGDICTIYDNWSLKNFKEPYEEQKIPFE